jgi:ABC-type Fe3+-siderophore transport system permease subunit
VSDFTDLGSFQDSPTGLVQPPRPSLSSLQTSTVGGGHEGYVYASPTSGWAALAGSHNIGYSPVSATDVSPPHKYGRGHAHKHHEAIPEEGGVDLGLVRSAAPIDGDETEKPRTRISSVPMFDLTNALGPTTQADEAFMKALQQQEAHGKLTGGLGLGIRTDTTVTESALLAASPTSERPLSRTFSRVARPLSRVETVKRLGQNEANKRGEVIEVVMDNTPAGSDVDISLVSGQGHEAHDTQDPLAFVMKQTTFPTRKGAVALFYPQPNWKPFSMRWPYLLSLIVVSLGLAASVEVLYQSSTRTPLVAFRTPAEVPTSEYFAIKFLPMIIAVSYGVLWQITNFEVMRLEPFYQLSKEGGALAAESINIDYLSQFNLFRPFRALHYRHYAVAVSSVASLLANTLVPTLGAASIILSPDREMRSQFPNGEKHILMHHVWSRLLIAIFAIIAVLGSILFYQLQTRRSGLLADVKGIAGLASMATVSHILMDFKDMDVATHQDIHNKLKSHRYILRNSSLAPDTNLPSSSPSTRPNDPDSNPDRYTKNHLSANPQPLMLRPHGALPFLALILLFTALLPVILFTPATALTDRAPWLVTALAVVIKLSWGALETDVRVMEPYYILSRRHAPPKTLCLDYTAMPFGWVAVKGLVNRHWVVFGVGLGTVVAEVLTVLVTSLATVEGRVFIAAMDTTKEDGEGRVGGGGGINAGQETVPSFWASLALAVVMLLYMGVVAGVVFVRRGRVFLPRQPNTIASVLAYIHQSKMLYGFVGTAKLSNAAMVKRLEELGKTYGLGWFQGRDGQSHCGVDEEELLSGYKVGYDYSRATKPWEEGEVNWL